MTKTIHHEFFFAHPVEKVWTYLTTAELMSQWLMPNDFEPVIGHDFQFRTKPIPSLDIDGIMYCKVLEIIPFKKLTYSWKAGPGSGKISLDSLVEWTLTSDEKGTTVKLEHSGFREIEDFNIYNGMNDGWKQKLHKIDDLLNAVPHDAANA